MQGEYAWSQTCLAQPLIAAEATTFVLIQKVAKNQVIRHASLQHGPLPRKSVKIWAGNICGHSAHIGRRAAKISHALPLRSRPPLFCLISPEAFLMTGNGN